jgi:hypothetical protein
VAQGAPTVVGTPAPTQTGYTVTASTSYSAKVKLVGTGSTDTAYESSFASGSRTLHASGLTCNTAYSFTVYAIDAGGYEYSTAGTVTTTACSPSSSGSSGGGSYSNQLSDAQAIPYYERIIAILRQILLLKSRTVTVTSGGASCVAAKPTLSTGSRGTEVKALQSYLITKADGPAAKKLASAGATGLYGQITKTALAELQKSLGITPASGIYGKITAGKIGCSKSAPGLPATGFSE